MVFSSSLFIFLFLPLFLLTYFFVRGKFKNYTLLIFSLIFYAWGAPIFVFILLGSLVINFYLVRELYGNKQNRSLFLWSSILINLGLLGYFKYANFFIENFNNLLSALGLQSLDWTNVALPIGISFFTFQSLTYTIDVYRGIHKPLNKISDYLLYILMFPQLIAGPIVRFHTIADNITDRSANETYKNRVLGIYRFILGLSKKVLIANVIGAEVDAVLSSVEELNFGTAWLAMIGYTFQIYFDFSGYSDMAIGLGKIVGFNFPENFNSPYISQNISEFWRRWHITLSTWMRDYLYIPLGGNRVTSKVRLYFNLGVVFLISGFWHGASWNFILWGAYHGFFLILDRLFLIRVLKHIPKMFRVGLTFLVVVFGWVLFRIENLDEIGTVLDKMFSIPIFERNDFSTEFYLALIFSCIFSFITVTKFGRILETYVYGINISKPGIVTLGILFVLLLVLCISYITSFGFNPFIYFRF